MVFPYRKRPFSSGVALLPRRNRIYASKRNQAPTLCFSLRTSFQASRELVRSVMSKNIFASMGDWKVVSVTGVDSRDFLQRLTSADFRKLTPGSSTPACLLQANGKITAYFHALCIEQNAYLLLAPKQNENDAGQFLADSLERMHFRETLTITTSPLEFGPQSYFRVLSRALPFDRALAPHHFERSEHGELWINENRWTSEPFKFDFGVLVARERLATFTKTLLDAGFSEVPTLEPQRILAHAPGAPNEINSSTMPLEIGLNDAVHENKGCYPGQEVIERIRALGQPPRLLVQVKGSGTAPGTPVPILINAQEVGTLTSVTQDPRDAGAWTGLGLIKRVALNAATTTTEVTVNTQIARAQLVI